MESSIENKGIMSKVNRELLVKTAIGVIVGTLSTFYPATLFWGE
jgi:hypothetical protein